MSAGDVKTNPSIRRILILRFSSLGDIVMATAMVRCLRTAYPDAQIDMVVRADFYDLIAENPHLNRKIPLPRASGMKGLWALKKELNQTGYDLIYDAHRSLRTLFLMPFLKARHKAYYAKRYLRRSLALTFKLPILNSKRMLERFIEPLARFGVRYDMQGPEVFLNATATDVAQKLLPAIEVPYVGIIPSAQWPGKRWPIEYFKEAMKDILLRSPYHLVVFGGPSDTFCDWLCRGFPPERVVNLQGKLSIAESMAAVDRCAFVVANDTGLMHVADARSKPSILMLGPTSAEMGCLPYNRKARILEIDLWCRPCSKNGQAPCIRGGTRKCLTAISADDVVQEALKLGAQLA